MPGDSTSVNDVRQGLGVFFTGDFSTGITNCMYISNDRIYALVERLPLGDWASFGYGIPLKKRKPSDVNKLAIVYDEPTRQIRFIVDGDVLLTVEKLGMYQKTDDYLVYNYGGMPSEVFPTDISYGFGVGDALSDYPFCKKPVKEHGKCSEYDWEACEYPRVPTGLVKTGSGIAYNPIFGIPFNATFVDEYALPSNMIYGQGASANLQRFVAFNKRCE